MAYNGAGTQKRSPIRLFLNETQVRVKNKFEHLCCNSTAVHTATVWGRLHARLPVIEVPQTSVLAYGSDDLLRDSEIQMQLSHEQFKVFKHEGDWYLIHGKILTFDDPYRDIPPIDQFVEFTPFAKSSCTRVLVPVLQTNKSIVAWLYSVIPAGMGSPLSSKVWDRI